MDRIKSIELTSDWKGHLWLLSTVVSLLGVNHRIYIQPSGTLESLSSWKSVLLAHDTTNTVRRVYKWIKQELKYNSRLRTYVYVYPKIKSSDIQ